MTENFADLAIEGNAAAGQVQEMFASDVTSAQFECEACGATGGVGSLGLYAAPMGAVLRCPHCDGIVLRAVHTPYGRWLQMPGALRFGSP